MSDTPPRASAPIFDSAEKAWILSRYADVLAAFRERRLIPIGSNRQEPRDVTDRQKVRLATMAALSPAKLAVWREQLTTRAKGMLDGLPTDRHVDLVREFLQPWCTGMAVIVTGADPANGARLSELAACLSVFITEKKDPALESRVAAAQAELGRTLGNMPMGEATYVALSQTLPCFLANAWLALLENPLQLRRLQSRPDLIPGAIEELLRYAGVALRLYRRATTDVALGDITISAGEDAILMLASANRDPEQFTDPDNLDIERQPAGQLGLGVGAHSCVAAALIRMGAAVATMAVIERLDAATVRPRVQWRGGAGVRCPSTLEVPIMRPSRDALSLRGLTSE